MAAPSKIDTSKCKPGWMDCLKYHLPVNPESMKACPQQLPDDVMKVWDWMKTVPVTRSNRIKRVVP